MSNCQLPTNLQIICIVFLVFLFSTSLHGSTVDHRKILKKVLSPVLLSSYIQQGNVQEIGGLNAYVTGSLDSKRGIIMAADVYGYENSQLRELADKLAASGFYVVVPDFFHGDPWTDNPKRPFDEWIKDHGANKGAKEATPLIEALKSKGVSLVGAIGFCWGGKVSILLAESYDLKAIVTAHPSFVTVDDIKEVKIPISILGAELDTICPVKLIKQYEEALATMHEVPSFVKIFPGVSHGWTVRYNASDKAAVKSAEEAHNDMLSWLTKYLI